MAVVEVQVARIGRPHGVRGEVLAEPLTDEPDLRLAPGTVLRTDPAQRGPLTVRTHHLVSGRTVLGFEGLDDRTAAESLRGTLLLTDVEQGDGPEDPEEFYDHQLVGLPAASVEGVPLGVVARVEHSGPQDLLVLRLPDGREALVPFVAALVPEVDLAAGRLVMDLPEGLLELDVDVEDR